MKSYLKYFAFSILVIIHALSLNAQEIQWSNHVGGTGMDNGGSSVTDNEGNTYYSGIFKGPECYFRTDTLYQYGYNGAFIVKYDSKGNELWAKRYGGNSSEGISQGFSDMIYDPSSDMIFCVGTIHTNDYGIRNILTKLDLDGKIVWMKTYPGASLSSGFSALTLDANNDIYVTGSISTTVNFDTIPVEPGSFIARFDNNGNCKWAKRIIASIYYVDIRGIKVLNDKIFVSGYMTSDKVIFIDTIKIDHKGLGSSMIMCFDKGCNVQWVTEGISKMTYSYSDLAIDKDNNIYYTGCFSDTISFSENLLITLPGLDDLFLVKMDKNGKVQWLGQTHAQSAEGVDLISDENGNTYVTGYFKGEGLFGNNKIVSLSGKDMFLARYNSEGVCNDVIHYANGNGNGLSQDAEGKPTFIFIFIGAASFGGNKYESYGYSDLVFAKCAALTGIEEPGKTMQNILSIYANPSNGKCTITIPDEFMNEKQLTLQIFDTQGRLIQQGPIEKSDGKIKLNIEAQAKGSYTAILGNGKKSYTGKIIFR